MRWSIDLLPVRGHCLATISNESEILLHMNIGWFWKSYSLYMMTPSNGNIFRVTGLLWGIHGSPVDSPNKKAVMRRFDIFFICAWTNRWANTRDAGDLRHHRAHYDVAVMMVMSRFRVTKTLPVNFPWVGFVQPFVPGFLWITLIFERSHRGSAAETPAKYERIF